jgi:CheY-like chemotaxis protein
MHILIVDDHREFAQTLATLLVESSAVPLTADICFDGAQAVEMAASHPPAVAFIDLEMPVMNGADAAAAIRAALRDRRPVMIAMTGNPDLLAASALAGLFDRTLCKPVQLNHLLEVVSEVRTS